MTFSPLINGTIPNNGKYSSRHGKPILKFLQHHWAGTTGGVERMTGPDQASANYVILTDGKLLGHVPEEFRAWTSGSFDADGDAITVEVQNIHGRVNGNDNDPSSWAISDAAYVTLVKLIADVAKRHGWGAVSTGNYQGHRQWAPTACPGGWLWARMENTRVKANKVLTGGAAAPVPTTPPVKGKTVWQLADEVVAGLHGSGDARKVSLGTQYAAVQAEVNRRHGVGVAPAATKTVSQLADEVLAGKHGTGDARQKSLGNMYTAVQNEVNRRTGGGGKAPQGVNISQLADKVLRGEFGSGDARVRALGANYAAVQSEVNRRLGGGKAVVASPRLSISQLADAVLRGEFGNGDDRKKRLGANYAAVQAEINRRL
ncbi:lysin A [Arthrobacter phage Ingrid]|nr:lysin A [Arthrobacter phage Ingrid]QFG10985.1 lysin A [Arthrobacter phage Loretta]